MESRSKNRYKRLPGKGSRKGNFLSSPFSKCTLYLGDDHLLAVDNNGFSEDYRRFYFPDIQAFITRKTKSGAVWSIILAFMTACSLTTALFLGKDYVRFFSWILSGAFFVFLLIHILKGPTCICHIMTAVQQDQLPSLNRLRVARKVIHTLRLAVEKTQGRLSAEEIALHQSEGTAQPAPSVRSSRQYRGGERRIRHYDGTVHMIAFALILADGFLIGTDLLYHTVVVTASSWVVGIAYCLCTIIALVKQSESDLPGRVQRITWASFGFIVVSYGLGYILMITTLIAQRPGEIITQWEMYREMLNLSPQDSPFLMAIYIFSAACSLTLGALGLIRVKRHRDDFRHQTEREKATGTILPVSLEPNRVNREPGEI